MLRLSATVAALVFLFPCHAQAQASTSASPQIADRSGESEADTLSVSVGGSFSTGDYGSADDTQIWSVPVVARVRSGPFQLSASLPWMSIRSDGTVFTGIDSTPLIVAPGITSTRRKRSGFGDLTVGASYDLPTIAAGVDMQLSARVKIPTASDRSQLSTGKTDVALGGRLSYPMGCVVPYASVTYRIFGDSGPWDLRNGIASSIGASYVLPARMTFTASYDYAQAASGFVGDSHELFAGFSVPLGNSPLRLTAFGTVGVSPAAPDAAGGLALAASF